MDWLLDSPVAQLHRFDFLAFYLLVIVFTAVAGYWLTRRQDHTGELDAPNVPVNPDPYEIAYLRGGVNEVARAAVFNLTQLSYLWLEKTDQETRFHCLRKGDAVTLPVIERKTYEWCAGGRKADEIFKPGELTAQLLPLCANYDAKLQRENLLNPPALHEAAARVRRLGTLGVAGLGVYKLFVAIAQGRSNVIFLILLGIFGSLLVWGVSRPSRLSKRGRHYLAKLQLAFERLKHFTPQALPEAYAASATPAMLAMGIFGVSALSGTAYSDFHDTFQKSANTSGGCGGVSSCSSCGGCGSSSCGGGGCGGGGCGGGCGG
jgi:uncharacterized protein (TIGR04222 family)